LAILTHHTHLQIQRLILFLHLQIQPLVPIVHHTPHVAEIASVWMINRDFAKC
jgi:hypothetical protein